MRTSIIDMKKKLLPCLIVFMLLITSLFNAPVLQANAAQADQSTFSWDNAAVYFVITDRFLDGDASNNHSYGRELNANGSPYPGYKDKVGTFHGGDLKGLTQKINEGYFTNLGINAIWITAPFEQIHGWVGGLNFRHYAYHGYYTIDYTEIDKNMGTEADLRTFVDTAHSKGIRIVFDVVMNHPGYVNLKDMSDFDYGQLNSGWYDYYYNQPESSAHYGTYGNYISYSSSDRWAKWWGPDWIRTNPKAPGYDASGTSDLTLTLSDLPDFKTESSKIVGLPNFYYQKWSSAKLQQETAELQSFFQKTGRPATVSNYLVKWLTDWVREYGIDGFRCDTAKHVDQSVWKSLKTEAIKALREWKAANPTKKLDDLDFWMTGEVWGQGVYKNDYYSNGFDSLINFTFKDIPSNMSALEGVYADYASKINNDPSFNVLSYISSHDTSLYNRNNLVNAGTALLLAPGGVQIFYGDESGRQPNNNYPWDQPTRTDMNWSSINQTVLSHWQKIGQFRNKHISVGAGAHNQLQASPYAFGRTYNKNGIEDKVAVVIGASGTTTVNVSAVFADGTPVRDFYTGNEAVVVNGKATFAAHANGVLLIEAIGNSIPKATVSASPAGGKFRGDSLTVNLSVKNSPSGKYTLDGSDPALSGISFTDGQAITIGKGLALGSTIRLRLYAKNEYGIETQNYVYEKTDKTGLTIHFKKPSNWGVPQLYYYETTPKVNEPAWATAPAMTAEGTDGWYTYSIDGAESARIIFKDNNGNQVPTSMQPGVLRTSDGWYDNGIWYNYDPVDRQAPTAPSNLVSTAKTGRTVSLSWSASTDNIGVTGYRILRSGKEIPNANVTGTSYTDSGLTPSTSYTYTVVALDAAGNTSALSNTVTVVTDTESSNSVTIYYKRGFSTPFIHYQQASGAWTTAPGTAMLSADAQYPGYSVLTIDMGSLTQIQAVFNNGNGTWDNNGGKNYVFTPGTFTFNGGALTTGAPISQTVPVTFIVNNAFTTYGQNVYLVGDIAQLGSWSTANAKGPAVCPNYPAWTITIDLPAGQTLQFKAIKKDSSGNVIWEGGSNHTYTVPASGSGTVTINWQN